jgi:hypothetical protein
MPRNGHDGPWCREPGSGSLLLMTPQLLPVADLGARRTAREHALLRAAHAPVRHVTQEFLAALNCRELAPARPILRAV